VEKPHTKKEQLTHGPVKKQEKLDNLGVEHGRKEINANQILNWKKREPDYFAKKGGDLMNILSWILFGLIVGTVANAIDPSPNKSGVTSSILLGVIDALVGGLLANLMFGITISGFNITTFLVAIAGSLLLLFFGKAMRRV